MNKETINLLYNKIKILSYNINKLGYITLKESIKEYLNQNPELMV